MVNFQSFVLAALAATTALANPVALNQRDNEVAGEQCGPVVCDKGLSCCNPSCGICTPPGVACTMQACGPLCGPRGFCPYGTECCNESCGYCTAPGEDCTKEFCAPPKPGN